MRVDVRDISREFALAADTARVLMRVRGAAPSGEAIGTVEVPDTSVGLLIADGELREVLKPGLTAYWKFQRNVKVELVDLRLQTMEVAGQEILTRDKVSVRVNLTALWQVLDAVQARTRLVNFVEYVYKELQFALREAVGARTLDELLGDKGAFDREISAIVAGKLEGNGVVVRSVGVKDVIFPGEMKTILNQLVRAGDAARQFNVSVAFQHDLCDLGEAVIKTRAIQAFEHTGTRYPIHRLIRCAASNKLQDVFDDLALNSGLAPQRLDTGTLLLDGDGVFVSAEGYRKTGYCSCTFNVWAKSKELADQTRATLLRVVGPCRVRE